MSRAKSPKSFHYRAFGLNVRSQIPLPELSLSGAGGRPDVWICQDHAGGPVSRLKIPSDRFEVSLKRSTFYWKNESRVCVDEGRRILVDILPGADPQAVRLSILGPAFSQLLAQRGLLVLHASAVSIHGRAVAFLGASGAGKSTLAAALHARGYELVTDNLLAVRFLKNKAEVAPAFGQFKLWPDSAKKMGWNAKKLPWIDAMTPKRSLLLGEKVAKRPLPLDRVYLLSQGRSARVSEATPAEKLFYLINHSFGAHTYGQNEALSPLFLECARLIRRVPIRFLKKNNRFSSLSGLVQAVERDS